MREKTIRWCLYLTLSWSFPLYAVSSDYMDTDSFGLVETQEEELLFLSKDPQLAAKEPVIEPAVPSSTRPGLAELSIPELTNQPPAADIHQINSNLNTPADYLADHNPINPGGGSEFTYQPTPQYEEIASLRQMAQTREGWNKLKSVGYAQAAHALLRRESRRRSQHHARPSLLDGATWRCGWDRIIGVHNDNHNSPNCLEAIQNADPNFNINNYR